MTEEIIIDGVNVAGCISFDKNNGYNICCYDDTREDKIPFANFCVENKDCYYKQLKRLKQENEKLKEEFEKTSDGFLKIQYKLANNCDNYRKALEEIREIAYTTDFDICDIQKICNGVLK